MYKLEYMHLGGKYKKDDNSLPKSNTEQMLVDFSEVFLSYSP